jgi:cell wall-associated NlpC family hydrolase
MKTLTLRFAIAGMMIAGIASSCHTNKQAAAVASVLQVRTHRVGQRIQILPVQPVAVPLEGQNVKENTYWGIKYAAILGVTAKSLTNTSLYKFIDEWYGVNYKYGGSNKDGIDCSAFVQKLYTEVFGIDLVRTALEQFNSCYIGCNSAILKEGDLVFFHTAGSKVSHVGVYLANNYFVHASTTKGVSISRLDDTYWKKAFASGGKILRITGRS